jgi:hypothetical protein
MCNMKILGRKYTMVIGALCTMAFFFAYTQVCDSLIFALDWEEVLLISACFTGTKRITKPRLQLRHRLLPRYLLRMSVRVHA